MTRGSFAKKLGVRGAYFSLGELCLLLLVRFSPYIAYYAPRSQRP